MSIIRVGSTTVEQLAAEENRKRIKIEDGQNNQQCRINIVIHLRHLSLQTKGRLPLKLKDPKLKTLKKL